MRCCSSVVINNLPSLRPVVQTHVLSSPILLFYCIRCHCRLRTVSAAQTKCGGMHRAVRILRRDIAQSGWSSSRYIYDSARMPTPLGSNVPILRGVPAQAQPPSSLFTPHLRLSALLLCPMLTPLIRPGVLEPTPVRRRERCERLLLLYACDACCLHTACAQTRYTWALCIACIPGARAHTACPASALRF